MAGEGNSASSEVIERWHRAVQRLADARREAGSAECELTNAANAAGRHLCPNDAGIGEEFQMWIRTEHLGMSEKERLVVVKRTGHSDYEVTWRKPKQTPKQV